MLYWAKVRKSDSLCEEFAAIHWKDCANICDTPTHEWVNITADEYRLGLSPSLFNERCYYLPLAGGVKLRSSE